MHECICNGCRNLKGIVNDLGAVDEYECEFGFPSDECADCEGGECDFTCTHFAADEGEAAATVKCAACGREMEQVCGDGSDGDVYCANCYFDR